MEELPFRVGDIVYITDNRSPYYSEEGRILAHLVSKHPHIPDKYDVVFADGRNEIFGDGQFKVKVA